MSKTGANQNIGALWQKEAAFKGDIYFSGHITVEGVTIPIVIFKNTRKMQDGHPDFYIHKSIKPAPERSAPAERFEPKINDNSEDNLL